MKTRETKKMETGNWTKWDTIKFVAEATIIIAAGMGIMYLVCALSLA